MYPNALNSLGLILVHNTQRMDSQCLLHSVHCRVGRWRLYVRWSGLDLLSFGRLTGRRNSSVAATTTAALALALAVGLADTAGDDGAAVGEADGAALAARAAAGTTALIHEAIAHLDWGKWRMRQESCLASSVCGENSPAGLSRVTALSHVHFD